MMRRLRNYLRSIRTRARKPEEPDALRELRPDDELDGCELDFDVPELLTRDEDIDALLIPQDQGRPLRGVIFAHVLAWHHRRTKGGEA